MADRACVALVDGEHILMVRQTYKGRTFWTFPGGAVEAGETSAAAAVREVKEEVGLDVALVRQLCEKPRASSTGMYRCYLGTIIGGVEKLEQNPELHELRWLPIAEMHDHPEVAHILKELTHL